MKAFGCIYVVTHRDSGRFYIGQTRSSAMHRWSVHKSEAKLRSTSYFHKAIKRYGPAAFDVEILATADDQIHLNRLEQLWILVTGAMHRELGYNLTSGGDSYVRSPETIARMRAALTGRRLSPAHVAAMARGKRGRPQTPEHRAHRSAALKGKQTPTDACRKAVAEANRHRVLSEHTRQLLRIGAQRANEVRWAKQRASRPS